LLWLGGFVAFAVIGSLHAGRAANAGRINRYYFDPQSQSDTLPYDTCRIPEFKQSSGLEPESYYWK